MKVGTKVRFTKDIYQDANDHTPAHYLAFKGDTAEILDFEGYWEYYVNVKIGDTIVMVGVRQHEIEVI